MAKRGLGRGFDSLISSEVIESEFDVTAGADEGVSELRNLRVSDVEANPDQPRREFDEAALLTLADSIKRHGLMQPIVVTAKGGKYQIVAGERRWRATKLAGLETIKAIVRTVSGQQKLELALIENLHREDLNPLETATALVKLRDQFNLTVEAIARQLGGKTRAALSNTIRLLTLPDFVKLPLAKGEITEGHGRTLLSLNGDEKLQKVLLDKIINEGWSVRAAERFVVAKKNTPDGAAAEVVKAMATTTDWTKKLSKKLGGATVSQHISTPTGGGRIVIKFRDKKELEAIEKKLA